MWLFHTVFLLPGSNCLLAVACYVCASSNGCICLSTLIGKPSKHCCFQSTPAVFTGQFGMRAEFWYALQGGWRPEVSLNRRGNPQTPLLFSKKIHHAKNNSIVSSLLLPPLSLQEPVLHLDVSRLKGTCVASGLVLQRHLLHLGCIMYIYQINLTLLIQSFINSINLVLWILKNLTLCYI
jgi:hypothetical protein